MRPRPRRRSSSGERVYVDVNVLYYYLTAHPQFGERARDHIASWGGRLVTSSLSAWLLYVLTGLENAASILEEVGVELAPLTAGILSRAEKLEKPRDFEDRVHVATMMELGVTTIISNDRDFDGLAGITRIF
jgi:predicted nucleic acid-binding protein